MNYLPLFLILLTTLQYQPPSPISYQFTKPISPDIQAQLKEIDDQIRELEDIKRGFLAKALRHDDQALRLQFTDRYYLEVKRHIELAEENRQAAAEVQKEIDRLKVRRRQILEQ